MKSAEVQVSPERLEKEEEKETKRGRKNKKQRQKQSRENFMPQSMSNPYQTLFNTPYMYYNQFVQGGYQQTPQIYPMYSNYGYQNQQVSQNDHDNVVGRSAEEGGLINSQEMIRTKVQRQFYPYLNEQLVELVQQIEMYI